MSLARQAGRVVGRGIRFVRKAGPKALVVGAGVAAAGVVLLVARRAFGSSIDAAKQSACDKAQENARKVCDGA